MLNTSANTTAAPSRLDELPSRTRVLIIGGGINGCGLFRDLCVQGVDCVLIDKNDFCSGASSAPSRLIHGGIKYLETGEFRLVRQSARERNLLLKNAPHYVTPLETVLPVYSWLGGIIPSIKRFFGLKAKLNDRGAVITEIGLLLYDLFGRHFRTMPNHRILRKAGMLLLMPELTKKIVAAGIYYEGRITHAERLGVELLMDGISDNPQSHALNHVFVAGSVDKGVRLIDGLTGAEKTVFAEIVVNAGGAWIDAVNASLGITSRHMGGNKGSHLIVRNERMYKALGGRMIYFGSADGRVNLLYPFMGNVLIGSTDIPVKDPDLARCDPEESAYLSQVTREVFPEIEIRPQDIVMTYCGVRPLPRSEGVDPGAVSRDHSIAEDVLPDGKTPVYSLIGGKWTTFRGFSEEAADLLLGRLAARRRRSTEALAIGGGRDYPLSDDERKTFVSDLARRSGVSAETIDILLRRYGTRVRELMSGRRAQPEIPLQSLPEYGRDELGWICRTEKVGRLSDILFRRTDIALSGRLTPAVIAEAAEVAAECLGWPPERRQFEIDATLQTCHASGMSFG